MPVGNHDLPRVATGQSEEDLALIFAFQCSWPGIPFIYYGDEIGQRQQSSSNPIHEGHYPTRNGARTPMQWNHSQNCGFSNCEPHQLYLPVDPNPGETTVSAQEARPDSLLHRIRRLNTLHCDTAAFAADAPIQILSDGAPGTPLVFIRGEADQQVLCFFQPAEGVSTWPVPASIQLPLDQGFAHSDVPPSYSDGYICTNRPSWSFQNL
jgi:maltose alpha-D-glucosyltransferase/alpha-amylase